MSFTVLCESCGESIAVDANFCEHRGTTLAVAEPAGDGSRQASARRSGFDSHPATERLESLTPGATELGALVQFRQIGDGGGPESYPIPVYTSNVKTNRTGEYRLFGFSEAVPAYEFIPLLIWLIGVPLLLALNAGFAIARLRAATARLVSLAWGALVGPIWAVAMVLINALIAKDIFGRANGDSAFAVFLIGGLVVGAVGGLLVIQSPKRQATGASSLQGLGR
jgi:hypothetical protein